MGAMLPMAPVVQEPWRFHVPIFAEMIAAGSQTGEWRANSPRTVVYRSLQPDLVWRVARILGGPGVQTKGPFKMEPIPAESLEQARREEMRSLAARLQREGVDFESRDEAHMIVVREGHWSIGITPDGPPGAYLVNMILITAPRPVTTMALQVILQMAPQLWRDAGMTLSMVSDGRVMLSVMLGEPGDEEAGVAFGELLTAFLDSAKAMLPELDLMLKLCQAEGPRHKEIDYELV